MATLWLEKDKTISRDLTLRSGWAGLLAVVDEGETFPTTTIKVQSRGDAGEEWSDTGTELTENAKAATIFIAAGFQYRLSASAIGAKVYVGGSNPE